MTINSGVVVKNTTAYIEGQSHASLIENGYYSFNNNDPIL
jgi:hypothetical protein